MNVNGSNKWEEKKKNEILQTINDLLDKYDWGGEEHKVSIPLVFKGKFNLLNVEVRVVERIKPL